MKEKYTKKQIEELYNCEIEKVDGYYVAVEQGKKQIFSDAMGWTLDELHENIREQIIEEVDSALFEE